MEKLLFDRKFATLLIQHALDQSEEQLVIDMPSILPPGTPQYRKLARVGT